MATTSIQDGANWNTVHLNGPFPTKILYKTTLESDNKLPLKIDRYNDASMEIQRLLQETLNAGEGFRAFGARWSMNNIAHHNQRMHFNENMNLKMSITQLQMHAASPYNADDLFFIQCGNKIKEITEYVKREGKSLKTCGASNGQTIGGAVATGVHGSALNVGAVQDFVVGLNLIIGPDANDNVYLERESQPALNNEFATSIQARVVRNDAMFNAALVSLGAFGFIHGVVIETENLFLLNRYVRKIDKELALNLATTMDFENSDFKIENEVDGLGKPLRPYHYKIFINPYNDQPTYVVEAMYKHNYKPDYLDPIPRIQTALYKDLILLFGKIAGRFKESVPKLIKLLEKDILPAVDDDVTGTLGEIFDDAINQGPAFACSVGVDHKDSERTLKLMVQLVKQLGPIPGIFAMRFVKSSEATLAFTPFGITCMIEIDGVLWKGNKKMISLESFGEKMIEALVENDIAFTIHWGKNAAWSFPNLMDIMYKEKVTDWKLQRKSLLSTKSLQLFSSPFLESTKLC